MNEEELKTMVGEAAFNAMSEEQRSSLMGKFAKPDPKGGSPELSSVMTMLKNMQTEITSLKGAKAPQDDPTITEIQKAKKLQEQQKADQDKVVTATKFNVRLDTFLKEYAGVLPADANEIPRVATSEKYPNEIERSAAIKAALMASFFKEEENLKYLSESQLAKWKAYQSLGTVGRQEEAGSIYDIVFEPAVNHARSIRQAQIKSKEDTFLGSKDSDIIMRKTHEKLLRSISHSNKLNDVLHEQAKTLGLVNS